MNFYFYSEFNKNEELSFFRFLAVIFTDVKLLVQRESRSAIYQYNSLLNITICWSMLRSRIYIVFFFRGGGVSAFNKVGEYRYYMYVCQIHSQLVLIAFRNVKKHDNIRYIYVSFNYMYKGSIDCIINIYMSLD